MLKWRGGGGTTSFEVVLTRELEVLAMGIAKSFHPLKVEGVANKSFGPITSPFCCETRSTLVIQVNNFQNKLVVEIYSKSLARAIGKVLRIKFR